MMSEEVIDMEADKVADEVTDVEVFKVADMVVKIHHLSAEIWTIPK